MALTPVGERFYQRTRSLNGTLTDAIKEATDMHLGAMGLLRVGLSPLYAQSLFVPAFVRLHEQRPAATLRISMQLNDGLWRSLRQGDLDLAISSLPASAPPDFTLLPLMRDDLCMVVRAGHPLLQKRRTRLQDLAHAQWMLPGPGVTGRRQVEARLADAGLPPPRVVLEVGNTTGQISRILPQTDLVTIMSSSMLQSPAGEGLVALPFAQARFNRTMGVTHLTHMPLSPLGLRLVQLLQSVAGI